MKKLNCLVAGAAALLCAAPALAQGPCQVIILRSGQVGGVPGLPGFSDDLVRRHPTIDQTTSPLSTTPFTQLGWFGPAASGLPAFVIAPLTPFWTPTLPCDPDARWINWEIDATFAGSALYSMPFNIAPGTYSKVTLSVCWAADDTLGDIPSFPGPNPVGIYINGMPTTPIIDGGNYAAQTTVSNIDITAQANSGLNHIQFYQRDAGLGASGLIFSARIEVECCDERVTFRSGQVTGGGPGLPGQLDVNVTRHPTVVGGGAPLSATAFNNPTWFIPAQSGPAADIIAPLPHTWAPTLLCDPQARWINHTTSAFADGSALYTIPINVNLTNIQSATLDLCWAQDDHLGDLPSGPFVGPNTAGVYLNGVALPISGGSYTQATVSGLNVLSAVTPGTNYLSIYVRELAGGGSGLIFSGGLNVSCRRPGPTPCECVDFNGDGEVDFTDVEFFLAAFTAQIPGDCAPGADFNGDGEFDFSDIEAFIATYVLATMNPC